MIDDLTRAIAEALDRRHHLNTADLAAHLADALAPLIEARVREARADELERAASEYPAHVRSEDEFWSYNTTSDAVEEIGVEYLTNRAEEWRAQARATGADQ